MPNAPNRDMAKRHVRNFQDNIVDITVIGVVFVFAGVVFNQI